MEEFQKKALEIMENETLGICPFMSSHDLISCVGYTCETFDKERECCSFNTKPIVINQYESAAISRIKDRFKVELLKILDEKTGWGRVELKQRLFDLIDGLKDESSL